MWAILCEVAKKKWRKQGKDPYKEWGKERNNQAKLKQYVRET